MVLFILQTILLGVLIFEYAYNFKQMSYNERLINGLKTVLQVTIVFTPYILPLLPILVL